MVKKGWVLTSLPPLINWRAKWQGHWGGGGEAAVYSKDNTFQWRFLYTVACRDQTPRLLFFTPRLNLSQSSELGCFSLANWREDSQADAGYSWNWGRSLILFLSLFQMLWNCFERSVFCLKINPMRQQGAIELGEICQVTIRKQQTCWQKSSALNRVELFLYGNFDTERVIMLEATNYMLSDQSSANQSKQTALQLLCSQCFLHKHGSSIKFKQFHSQIQRIFSHMENASEVIQNTRTVPRRKKCLLFLYPPSEINLNTVRTKSKNDSRVYLGQIVTSLHPWRNISRLGDRDSECRVSKMFEVVHPTQRRNRQGGRGHLEIALPNKPLVSPLFTLIWPMVPPDGRSWSVNIHSLKTNKSSVSYWVGHGLKVLWFLP